MFFLFFFYFYLLLSRIPFGVFIGSRRLHFDKDPQTTCKRSQVRTRWKPPRLPPVINTASGRSRSIPEPSCLALGRGWTQMLPSRRLSEGGARERGNGESGRKGCNRAEMVQGSTRHWWKAWEWGVLDGKAIKAARAIFFFHPRALLSPRLSISPLFT